jgi:hypothetical protein
MNALIYEQLARERDREAHSQARQARQVRIARGTKHHILARRADRAASPDPVPTPA